MKKKFILIMLLIILLGIVIKLLCYFGVISRKKYLASDFNITVLKSKIDYNNNGIDDYTDILNGAKKDAKNKPRYKSSYYNNGYPPDNIGVCTDVIWRAFKEAGYSLKEMVNNDIANNMEDYNIKKMDKNIDFRRVVNLRVFFDKYAQTITNDIYDIEEWMPGDIVIFGNNSHIGIVSDYHNKKGISYIIHNGGQPVREEDYLERATVTKHYRFDASLIDSKILIKWND